MTTMHYVHLECVKNVTIFYDKNYYKFQSPQLQIAQINLKNATLIYLEYHSLESYFTIYLGQNMTSCSHIMLTIMPKITTTLAKNMTHMSHISHQQKI